MKDIITNELLKALKNGDKERIHTLRLIIAAIKDKEIASRSSGEDPEILDETIIQLLNGYIAVYDHRDESTTYKAGNCLS